MLKRRIKSHLNVNTYREIAPLFGYTCIGAWDFERNGRKMAKFLKDLGRSAEKSLHRSQKKLYGKKSLSVKHSYNNSVSVYRNNNEKHPLITLSADGECRISVFKLIIIILSILCAAALLLFAIKKIAKFRRRKLTHYSPWDEFCAYSEEDDLPF